MGHDKRTITIDTLFYEFRHIIEYFGIFFIPNKSDDIARMGRSEINEI
jgi:hypothetical protein